MLRRLALVLVIALGALGLVAGTADAAPACGGTINHDVTLHHNLDCSGYAGPAPAITFGKSGITLNLNHHKIIGPTGADSIVGVKVYELHSDVIKNGEIENFGSNDAQIWLEYASNTVVRNVRIVAEASDTSAEGIYVEYGAGNRIGRITAVGGKYGLEFYYSAHNVVTHSLMNMPTSYGVYTNDDSLDAFIRNRVIAASTSTEGFYDDSESNAMTYVHNVANGGDDGFELYSYGDGFVVLRNNVANNNSSDGFYLDEPYNEYTGASSTIVNNTANGNGGDGFNVDYPAGATITWNTSNGNMSDSGFYLENDYAPYDVKTFSDNTANNNPGGYGLYADYGAAGHNNHAHGNPTLNYYNVAV